VGSTPTLAIYREEREGRFLNIEVHNLEGCKRRLDIQIPAGLVNDEIARASAEMARYARVPGFRPGRVPMSVIRNRFKAELRQEALRNLLPSAVETAVEMHRLRVIGEPSLDKLEFADDGTLDLAVLVEVAPDFELKGHKGLELTRRVYKIRDEDVDAVLDRMREEQAQLVAVDEEGREARDGDFVSVDLEGAYVDEGEEHAGHHHEPIKADDVSIEIGGENVQPEFTEALRGLKVGETATFRVAYPAEAAPSFAGHTVEYTARVASIRVREVPELDDAFASEQGDFETADDLRKAIREDLEHRAGARTESELRDAALDALLAAHEFPVPEVMTREQAQMRVQNLVRTFAQQGLDPRGLQLDWASLRDSALGQAERDVRAMFIIDRVAREEQITPSDEEVEAEIERMSEAMNMPIEQLRARLTKEGGADSIRDQMRTRKALDFVIDAANVTTEEVDGLEAKAAGGDEGSPERDDDAATRE
jgi:trigger factor